MPPCAVTVTTNQIGVSNVELVTLEDRTMKHERVKSIERTKRLERVKLKDRTMQRERVNGAERAISVERVTR